MRFRLVQAKNFADKVKVKDLIGIFDFLISKKRLRQSLIILKKDRKKITKINPDMRHFFGHTDLS